MSPRKYSLIILLFLTSNLLYCQVNSDSIFSSAVQKSRLMDYTGALSDAGKVLALDPGRTDVMVFIANVHAWQHHYDEAKKELNRAFTIDKTNPELYDSWLNILLWNKEGEALLKICSLAESNNYRNDYNLFLKRMQAYNILEDYKKITALAKDEKYKKYRDSLQIAQIYDLALLQEKSQTLSAYYSLDFFDQAPSQHLANIEFSTKIRKDRLIFRINGASRFGEKGLQLESDFYKMLSRKTYMYFNYGYSIDNIIFPLHRAGYELYFPLSPTMESSLGARYLRFPNRDVFIGTVQLSKYIGNNWFSVRPFYVTQQSGNSFSLVADYRRYADVAFKYWGMEFGYGNSPDDRFALTQTNQFLRLEAYRFKLEKNFLLFKTNEFKMGAAYTNEEYISGSFRNRYTLELTYKFRM